MNNSDIHPKTPDEIAAQLWCRPQHSHKQMDSDFCQTIAEAIAVEQRATDAWHETAAQHCRNEFYYRDLVRKIGSMLGKGAYTADDGGVHDDVLCAKVPELVEAALKAKSTT